MAQPAERRLVTEAAISDDERRVALGVAAITRGTLPAGTDLNSLNSAEWAGTWRLTASAYGNLPVNSLVGAAVLHVKVTDNGNGLSQEMELGTAKYFRKSVVLGEWYGWRQVVDTTMLTSYLRTSRGTLATATDLNTLALPEHAGTHHIAASNVYENLPEGLTITEASVLRVDVGNGLNSCAQTLIHHTAQKLDYWVREIRVAANSQNPTNSWQPWKRIPTADEIADLIGQGGGGLVRSSQVTRIIASTNANATLQDGDLLLVYGGA